MSKKTKVLLAEDEISLGQIVTENLILKGFDVTHCYDGEKALQYYQTEKFDVLVLDIMMPKKDGFTLAKEIRQTNETIPILFLTAKSQTSDVVEGFESGGNDYLKKPFSMDELIVRIKALANRNTPKTSSNISNSVEIGKYTFNSKKQKLSFEQTHITLTSRESDLLQQLYLHKNDILERTFILKKLWGNDDFFKARSMDVFISKLRKKLKLDKQISIINVRGYGYKLIC